MGLAILTVISHIRRKIQYLYFRASDNFVCLLNKNKNKNEEDLPFFLHAKQQNFTHVCISPEGDRIYFRFTVLLQFTFRAPS